MAHRLTPPVSTNQNKANQEFFHLELDRHDLKMRNNRMQRILVVVSIFLDTAMLIEALVSFEMLVNATVD